MICCVLLRNQAPADRRVRREAGRIISEYIEPGPRDAEQTLTRLIAVLDTQDLARAIERLEKGSRIAGGEEDKATWPWVVSQFEISVIFFL